MAFSLLYPPKVHTQACKFWVFSHIFLHESSRFMHFYRTEGQCCGSGMFIPDPGSWFLPIPDPGSKNSNKRERWKKLDVKPFYVATKFNKIVNYFSFEVLKKKNLGQFSKNFRTFYQKNCQKALQNMVFGSRIQGSKRHRIPDPGSRIRIRNTAEGP